MQKIFEEFIKCGNNFPYFAENYLKIHHPTRGLIKFPLYDYQKRLINYLEDSRFVILKKFRQGGFSTLGVLYGLWQCLFQENKKFLFISKTHREAISLGTIAMNAMHNLPDSFKPLLSKNNIHEKVFGCTGSRMDFMAAQAVCGHSCTHLVIDEAAFIPEMDKHWKAFYPMILEGKVYVISTVNGANGWFYKTYKDAEEGRNNFKIFKCDYKEHPDYQNDAWVTNMKKNLGELGWQQEILANFL